MIAAKRIRNVVNIGPFFGDASICIGIASGLAGLSRIEELVVFFHTLTWQGFEINRLRAGRKVDKEMLSTSNETNVTLAQNVGAIQGRVTLLEADVRVAKATAQTATADAQEAKANVSRLELVIDSCVVYIHAVTSYGLRLQKLIKRSKIATDVDLNLPKPSAALLPYLPGIEEQMHDGEGDP